MDVADLDFSKICRICLLEGTMMSLFKVNMSKKMMSCASVQVWPSDGLPGQICTKCASKLHISYQFKKQCEKSDLKLRQFLLIKPIQEEKKIIEVIHPNVEIVEGNARHQDEGQTTTHHIYVQGNNTVMENLAPEHTYDHFMTVSQNAQQIQQVTYENLTSDNRIHVENYDLQSHMVKDTTTTKKSLQIISMPSQQLHKNVTVSVSNIFSLWPPMEHTVYNTQYTVPTQPIQQTTELQPSPVIQLEITPQTALPQIPSEKANENIENLEKEPSIAKETQEGKPCPTCGKMFKTNIKLNRHMKIHNIVSKEYPHKCSFCGKGFSHSGNFKIHLRIHSNERPYKCPVCSKGCRQAQDLEKHMRTHTGERPHKCHFCPKAFATSSNLTAHIRTHTGERPYVCCVCQKAFCQSNELTKHMRTHTGEKSHICDICNKGFNGSSGLLAHRRQHTGERPYVCQHCQRGFTSSNCLAAHVKTHNKANPLQCGQCELTFSSLLNLKNHVSADHSVAEPLQCKMCRENFDKVTEYVLHMRTHAEQAEES